MTRLAAGRERNLAEAIGQDRPILLGDRVALRFFIDGERQGIRREKWCRSEKRQHRYDSEPVVDHLSVLLFRLIA
jgi:hypothetical protein